MKKKEKRKRKKEKGKKKDTNIQDVKKQEVYSTASFGCSGGQGLRY